MCKRVTAVLFVIWLLAPLAADERAPQNDSIRQDDLRADLFFLAGDAMRGRLTDTEENRATGDFIRSRFERMGLKPAAPNGSYFETYNLPHVKLRTVDDLAQVGLRELVDAAAQFNVDNPPRSSGMGIRREGGRPPGNEP